MVEERGLGECRKGQARFWHTCRRSYDATIDLEQAFRIHKLGCQHCPQPHVLVGVYGSANKISAQERAAQKRSECLEAINYTRKVDIICGPTRCSQGLPRGVINRRRLTSAGYGRRQRVLGMVKFKPFAAGIDPQTASVRRGNIRCETSNQVSVLSTFGQTNLSFREFLDTPKKIPSASSGVKPASEVLKVTMARRPAFGVTESAGLRHIDEFGTTAQRAGNQGGRAFDPFGSALTWDNFVLFVFKAYYPDTPLRIA
ncbi:hypothetical protein B0H13DRAFT_1871700 [Mycena leptocephala]|nr:hypothetical protein B0H13DRAFT_1871700 [Mycena leptocephala]